ncbi:hypothetical protein SK128_015437 [Halocaridina rubra]|uniref:Uncharacterized protein n=1 Tax=Halocaridina rubra TaxID=373956 RepID=A0AAN9A5H8_HALRR
MDNLATAISEEGASEGLFRESGPLESRTHVNGTRQRRTGRTEQAPFQINYAAVNGNQIATLTLLDEMPQVDFKTSEDDSSALTKADLANRHSLAHSQNNTKQLEISVADEVQPESKSNLEISPTVNDHQILDEIQDTDQNATHQESHVEKKRGWFTETHNRCFALIYAIVLVSCGFFIYSSDSMMYPHYALAEGYNIYLIIMQMVFLIYIHIDTRQYIKRQSKERKKAKKEGSEDQNGVCHGAGAAPKQYGFTTGRYCGSLYLKIGAAGYQVMTNIPVFTGGFYLTSENNFYALYFPFHSLSSTVA